MKIAIFCIYFGNLPKFTDLFLASCNRNPSIDFLLIGNAWRGMETGVPENCQVRSMDLNEFKSIVEEATKFKPSFSSAYKLCDFKPALGEIFREELSPYDYWGFCDIDLILGDIRSFVSNLQAYDVFSTRQEFLSGPFFLMRNTEAVNRLYRNSRDVDTIMTSDRHHCFDECNFAWEPLRSGKSIFDVETEIESMTEVIAKAASAGTIRAHFSTIALEPARLFKGKVIVAGGRVCKDGCEYIHYHHLHNKGRSLYTYPKWHWSEVPDRYLITKYGAYCGFRPLDFFHRFGQFSGRWSRRFDRWFKANIRGMRTEENATKIT